MASTASADSAVVVDPALAALPAPDVDATTLVDPSAVRPAPAHARNRKRTSEDKGNRKENRVDRGIDDAGTGFRWFCCIGDCTSKHKLLSGLKRHLQDQTKQDHGMDLKHINMHEPPAWVAVLFEKRESPN